MAETTREPPESAAEYLAFIPVAVAVARDRLPDLDPVAMQAVMLLHRTNNVVIGDLEAVVHRRVGWSFAGFRLLLALWVSGPLGVSRLVELSGVGRVAVTTLSQRMERDGLVRRDPAETDGGDVIFSLTDSGSERLARTFADHNQRESRWVAHLEPAEQLELIRLLGKLGSTP